MSLIGDALTAARRENGNATDTLLVGNTDHLADPARRPRWLARAAGAIAVTSLAGAAVTSSLVFVSRSAVSVLAPNDTPTVLLQSKAEPVNEPRMQAAAPVPSLPAPSAQMATIASASTTRRENAASAPRTTTPSASVEGEPATTAVAIASPRAAADSLFRLAYDEQMSGDQDTAADLYERSIATGRASAEAYNDFGVLLLARGDRSRAAELFREALNRNDRSVEAWVNLGDIFSDAGRRSEAIANYSRANRLDPARVAVNVRLAREFEAIGDLAAARRYLESAGESGAADSTLTDARRRMERLTRAP
jgi:Flp pilus assembly protein TadD